MRRPAIACMVATLACGLYGSGVRAQGALPRLVDLGAEKCIPCKKMAPVLEELKKEYAGRLDVVFIDVWQKENADKVKAYAIKLIPTQIFYSAEGKELWRHEGFLSKEAILAKWKELGIEMGPAAASVQNNEEAK